jgi:hypothetical protein
MICNGYVGKIKIAVIFLLALHFGICLAIFGNGYVGRLVPRLYIVRAKSPGQGHSIDFLVGRLDAAVRIKWSVGLVEKKPAILFVDIYQTHSSGGARLEARIHNIVTESGLMALPFSVCRTDPFGRPAHIMGSIRSDGSAEITYVGAMGTDTQHFDPESTREKLVHPLGDLQ